MNYHLKLRAFNTSSIIVATSAIAPYPSSPHINFFWIVGITITPSTSFRVFSYNAVKGCSYISVFIAGATIAGFLVLKSQHLKTDVNKLSQRPLEIFPKVLAERGAIIIN